MHTCTCVSLYLQYVVNVYTAKVLLTLYNAIILLENWGLTKSHNMYIVFHFCVLLFHQDLDSIVMTIDMHLTLPTGFVEAIRRVSVDTV